MFADLTAKTLDISRLVFPKLHRIGVLTSSNPTHAALAEVAARAAGAKGFAGVAVHVELDAVAVVFDLVNPLSPRRSFHLQARLAGG
ncbi:hypothetical protein [Bradyrhizobium canariense]|uniref:hypothetical protein n=1 Tax=Bradyrhizobium canariense TaxID=255045 RepID=UPI0013747727|nr:hypothetical protein [Bradyrhizobium canariense]